MTKHLGNGNELGDNHLRCQMVRWGLGNDQYRLTFNLRPEQMASTFASRSIRFC